MSGRNGFTPAEQALTDFMEAMTQRWEESQVRLESSLSGVRLRGALPVQIGTGGTVRPAASAGALTGWSVRNTGGGAATLVIRDGHDVGGTIVASVQLAIGESTRDWFGPGGVSYTDGLFIDLTGTIEGALYLRGGE